MITKAKPEGVGLTLPETVMVYVACGSEVGLSASAARALAVLAQEALDGRADLARRVERDHSDRIRMRWTWAFVYLVIFSNFGHLVWRVFS